MGCAEWTGAEGMMTVAAIKMGNTPSAKSTQR
jgi:hypothetical protein